MSDEIRLSHDGYVSTVSMNRPPMNLLDPDYLDALVAAYQEADANPDTRVVISRSAVPGIYSNGLDPMQIVALDQPGRIAFFEAVGRVIEGVTGIDKPHIAVINGPAMAGGAVLAILADFRYFDAELGRISFAEAKVGVPVPPALLAVIARYCSPAHLRDVVMLAKNLDAQAALEAGLADAVATGDALEEIVAKQAERLARISPAVNAENKRNLRRLTAGIAEDLGAGSRFATFLSDEFLGEGITALLEDRHPNFTR